MVHRNDGGCIVRLRVFKDMLRKRLERIAELSARSGWRIADGPSGWCRRGVSNGVGQGFLDVGCFVWGGSIDGLHAFGVSVNVL